VITFRKEHFHNHLPILFQARRRGAYGHAFGTGCGTGGMKFWRSGDFHHAQAAASPYRQAFKETERRNINIILACHLKDRFTASATYIFAVDLQRDGFSG
jgi:hypothetical protein